jgi:hypothetical protein|tara:strand:+ start:179 stop:358 length:180 start_codon:yes stop_codon:yes gene_type:complete
LIFLKINKTFAENFIPPSSQAGKKTVGANGDTITINSGIILGNLTQQQKADINEKTTFL